jgi:hypothetical protein
MSNLIVPYQPEKNFTNLDMDTDRLRLMWFALENTEDMPAKLTHEEAWTLQTGLRPNEEEEP